MCWQSRKGRHQCNSFQNKFREQEFVSKKKLIIIIFRISHTCVSSISTTIFLKTLMFTVQGLSKYRSYSVQSPSELKLPTIIKATITIELKTSPPHGFPENPSYNDQWPNSQVDHQAFARRGRIPFGDHDDFDHRDGGDDFGDYDRV